MTAFLSSDSGVRIDYRQDGTFYYVHDDSFYGRGWNIPFEYDESVRNPNLYENQSGRAPNRNYGNSFQNQSA